MLNKITFSELQKIVVAEFGLKGFSQSLKGSEEAQNARCAFIRLAFIHCNGTFDDISDFLGQQLSSTSSSIVDARKLMKNPYHNKVVCLIETQIKWKNKH